MFRSFGGGRLPRNRARLRGSGLEMQAELEAVDAADRRSQIVAMQNGCMTVVLRE